MLHIYSCCLEDCRDLNMQGLPHSKHLSWQQSLQKGVPHTLQDPEVVRSFKKDPYNFVGPVRARTGNELLKGFRDLQAQEHELGLPIYAHHGNADKITSLPVRWGARNEGYRLDCWLCGCTGAAKPCMANPAITTQLWLWWP